MPDVKRGALRRARHLNQLAARRPKPAHRPRPLRARSPRSAWVVEVADGARRSIRWLPIAWTERGVTAELDGERFWIRYGEPRGVPFINKRLPIPPDPAPGDKE